MDILKIVTWGRRECRIFRFSGGGLLSLVKLNHFWTITFSRCGKSNLPTTSLSNSFRGGEGVRGREIGIVG